MSNLPMSGFLLEPSLFMPAVIISVLLFLTMGYLGAPLWVWSLTTLVALVGFNAPMEVVIGAVVILALLNVPMLRRMLLSSAVMKTMKAFKLIPKISATERTALEAGVVWMEAELFSGKPNLKKLIDQPYPKLSPEEQSFMDNEVEELCRLVDDYEFFQTKDMAPAAWDYLRKKGFLGLIIPKEYGGKGFSHSAHSAIVQKVSSRSIAMAIYVMVPNSLGPAELLNHYGTQEQKKRWLPRLADGSEIPCFGLTEPMAGSDAGSITSDGVLFKGPDGQLYIRLNWKKRWITLASIATVLGLAFRLKDPEKLLGGGEDVGITCALVPSNLKGVVLGRRHNPIGVPFHNCPMEGHDVVVKADEAIIGGLKGAGQGWQMLMECLGAGRGISLPAQAAGGTKMVARVCGNHSVIRKQFGVSIGKFEGVEEPLARIAGYAYQTEALRNYILSALDQKISPPVCTAIAKFNATELGRKSINDGMDVMGGAGISLGPRNVLAHNYIGIPISITVEGANILTRTLMIFGQGALRAHPYAFKEVNAMEKGDLKAFDQAFWGHIGHIIRNKVRATILTLTRGHIVLTPVGGPARRYYQKLAWASASFAFFADVAMGLLGGRLKIREKLTGRYADILSWMFIATAILRRWEAEGRPKKDTALFHYSMRVAFSNIQEAFDGIFSNMDVPIVGWFFRGPIRWWSRLNTMSFMPGDQLTHEVAQLMLNEEETRDRLSAGIYMPKEKDADHESLARLERAYKAIKKAAPVEKKLAKARREKLLPKKMKPGMLEEAVSKNIITRDEAKVMEEAERLRYDAIQVDDFDEQEYHSGRVKKEETRSKGEIRHAAFTRG